MKRRLQIDFGHTLQSVSKVKLELAVPDVHKLQAPKSVQAHHEAGPPH